MNEILATRNTSGRHYLLGSPNMANNLYRQIEALLPDPELDGLFSEPVVLENGERIAWRSGFAGKAVCYSMLGNEADKAFAKTESRRMVAKLQDCIARFSDPKLVDMFNKCIEVPSLDCLYVVDNNGQKNITLVEWGFVPDTPGAEHGLISKYIATKRVELRFNVFACKDGRRVPGQFVPDRQLVFDINGSLSTITSNQDGQISIPDIKEDTRIRVYEADDLDKAHPQEFVAYENGIYDVYVTPYGDMQFIVEDQFGNILPYMDFVFEYNGTSQHIASDDGGRIVLRSIKDQTRVDSYLYSPSSSKENFNSFVYDCSTECYKIVVSKSEPPKPETPPAPPAPENGTVSIKVLDDKGQPAANANVTVKYLGRTEKYLSDSEGVIMIKDVPVGTHFQITAEK